MANVDGSARPATPAPDMVGQWVSPMIAEFVGAFALTFMGAGAIIMTAGQNLVAIALAHGLAIGLLVAAASHISGGYYNPAVAVGLLIGGKERWERVVLWIIAELLGAMVAALLLKAVFPATMTEAVALGTPAVGPGFNAGRAFLAEIITSFFLMYVIYGVAVDKRGPTSIAGLAIGLTITMDIFGTAAISGAAMNPSRHFGTALVGNHWDNFWIWYTAPFLGMAIAALVYAYIHMEDVNRAAGADAAP